MNQILITGDENYKNNKNKKEKQKKQKQPKIPKETTTVGINSIVIFFSISIIILGICLISGSVYAKEKINTTVEASIKPNVETIRNDDNNTLEIKVTHIRGISQIAYRWNNDDEVIINGNNQEEVSQVIDLLGGKNTLSITVTEENGQTVTYEKQFTVGNIPEITLEAVSNGVKLTATSEVEIQYISYAWDNGEPTQIEVGNTTYEGTIETPQGRHTLNLEVVDINNNKGTKEQVVVGDTAPTLTVNPARVDEKLVFTIDAEDDEEISRIEITLNDGEKQVIEVNAKTYHGEVDIVDGENRLVVTAYNLNNLSVTSRKLFRNE